MIRSATRLAAVCVLCCTLNARADWTRFRGPNGSGISSDGRSAPVAWSPSANVKWKTDLPGAGVSCPVVVGDRVYLTCYSGYGLDRENPGDMKDLKRHVVAVDRKGGSIVWSKTIDAVLPEDPYSGPGVPAHGYASNTPVSDGENLYVFLGKSGVFAFDKGGKQLWQTSVGKESDPRRWGSASSPILYKDLVIVPAIAESESLVGLDKKSGKEVWRQEASGLSNSWCTPILVEVDKDRTDLVIAACEEVWGINPETGKLRWYCEGAKSGSYCSSLISQGDVVYGIEGRGGKSFAVRVGGKGDVTKSHVQWTGRDSARFGTPVVYKDRIYSFNGDVGTAINAKNGEKVHQARFPDGGSGGGRGGDYASPVLSDGRLYYVRKSGDVFVVRANDELERVSVNRVTAENEEFSATPAISDGEVFLRSNKHLYCVAPMGQTVPADEKVAMAAPASNEGDEAEGEGGGRGRGRGGRGERGGRGGRGSFDPEQWFKDQDKNSDGKLSGDEISERMRDRVGDIDTDKDGAISMEELRSGRGRMFGGRGAGRGGRGGRGGGVEGPARPERPKRPPLET